MGRKSNSSIQEEESLAEEIRNFACLYDKSCADYKDKHKKINAWKAVEVGSVLKKVNERVL